MEKHPVLSAFLRLNHIPLLLADTGIGFKLFHVDLARGSLFLGYERGVGRELRRLRFHGPHRNIGGHDSDDMIELI